jgi:hypothetical protein
MQIFADTMGIVQSCQKLVRGKDPPHTFPVIISPYGRLLASAHGVHFNKIPTNICASLAAFPSTSLLTVTVRGIPFTLL